MSVGSIRRGDNLMESSSGVREHPIGKITVYLLLFAILGQILLCNITTFYGLLTTGDLFRSMHRSNGSTAGNIGPQTLLHLVSIFISLFS